MDRFGLQAHEENLLAQVVHVSQSGTILEHKTVSQLLQQEDWCAGRLCSVFCAEQG